MERARQLTGEILIYCFLVVLFTGGFLAFFFTPGDGPVYYNGSYEPLRGILMSEAYDSTLKISLEVRGGLFVRQLHYHSAIVLGSGIVVWVLLGLLRYGLALLGLGLGALAGLSGFGATDDVLGGTFLGKLPSPWWYGLHLAAALALAATLVISSHGEAGRQPRTPTFVAFSVAVAVLAIFWR